MRICDNCGQREEKHKEVGPVNLVVQITGYHHQHHTHPKAPWNWSVDLCPKCTELLKLDVDTLLKEYNRVCVATLQ